MADENMPLKYMKYAIGEIILVVIGILIALQINNWNENRKAATQEVLYLNRLLSENMEDVVTFSGIIEDLEKGNQTIVNFSKALKNQSIEDSLLIQSAFDYFKTGSIYPIFTWSNSTFEDLSSTGNLTLIKNTDLRDHLVKHYARCKQVEERIQIGTNWAIPIDAPFTFENDILKFEPTTSFLFPEQDNSVLANELRDRKVTYISNAAAHYWINTDAITHLKHIKQASSDMIVLFKEELNTKQ
jgi:hypothetical protein